MRRSCGRLRTRPGRWLIPLAGMLAGVGLTLGVSFAEIRFEEVGESAGLTHVGNNYGCSWVDANGDGFIDLYVGRHGDAVLFLYINNGDGTFRLTKPFLPTRNDYHGAAWGDFDNDGRQDVFITVGAKDKNQDTPKELYHNEGNDQFGNPIFTEIAAQAGVQTPEFRERSAAWLDYNGDGLLDLLVMVDQKITRQPTLLYHNNGDGTFTDVAASLGLTQDLVFTNGGIGLADYDQDGRLDLFLTAALTRDGLPLFFRQNPDLTYTNVLGSLGLGDLTWTRGVAWGDYDNDGDLDLYVTRGYGMLETALPTEGILWTPDHIDFYAALTKKWDAMDGIDFITSGKKITINLEEDRVIFRRPDTSLIFIGAAGAHPSKESGFSLQVGHDKDPRGMPPFTPGETKGLFIWRDVDGPVWHIRWSNDGTKTLYGKDRTDLPNTLSRKSVALTVTTDGQFESVTAVDMEASRRFKNRLYRNDGGQFTDVTAEAGVGDDRSANTAFWADFDNDGFLDLFVLNSNYDLLGNKPFILYRNLANGRFQDVTDTAGFISELFSRRACAIVGDYDNDGHLDIFVANEQGPPPQHYTPVRLYHNTGSGNHWLKVNLVGTISNRDAIGAKVVIEAGGRRQFREQNGGFQLFAQNSRILHVGLGAAPMAERITVTWPTGIVQTVTNVAADQTISITETGP